MTGKIEKSTVGETAAPFRRIFLFFLPLVVLAVSQSLTYPLVGSIVSHGPLGEQEYASYVMGQQVLFFLGAIGGGLITTSMMFCRNLRGYANFLRMNQGIALTAAAMQGLACLPPFDQWVFGGLFGLDGESFRIARNSLLLCIPLQYVFFVRNPYLGTLFVEKHSDLTNIPTVLRVFLAFYFAWQFPKLGWTGYRWGVVASTVPAVLETALTYALARPFLRRLPETPLDGSAPASSMRQLRYTLPLSLGGMLLSASAIMVSFFLSRSPDPETFRPVHFFAIGVLNPISFSALKLQTVVVAFPPRIHGRRRILGFAVAVAVGMSLLPVLSSLMPSLSRWYFCTYQSLPESDLGMARTAMVVGAAIPFFFAFRGYAEGLAAVTYRTDIVMRGQIGYFLALVTTLALCHWALPVPGYLWGVVAIAAAAFTAFATVRLSLHLAKAPREI